jgi:hypothetical protein
MVMKIIIITLLLFFAGCGGSEQTVPPDKECCRKLYVFLCQQKISEKEKDREMKRHYIEKHSTWWQRNQINQNGR